MIRMRHLLLFYLIFTYSVGFSALVVCTYLFLKTGQELLKYFILFYMTFTVKIITTTIALYINFNVTEKPVSLSGVISFADNIDTILLFLTLALVTHSFFRVPYIKAGNIVFSILSVLLIILYLVTSSYWAVILPFIFVNVYSLAAGILMLRRAEPQLRKMIKGSSLCMAFFIPLIFIPVILDYFSVPFGTPEVELIPLIAFPALYLIIAVSDTVFFFRYFRQNKTIAGTVKGNRLAELYRTYNISGREAEIIDHIIEGRSNKEIGIRLFISDSTVKKHTHNIFSKLNITSRFELISRINKLSQ